MLQDYKVFTLNARELINLCEDSNYNRCFDLNSGYLRSKLIRPGKDKDRYYSASALLDQICKTLITEGVEKESAKEKPAGSFEFTQAVIKSGNNTRRHLAILTDNFFILIILLYASRLIMSGNIKFTIECI